MAISQFPSKGGIPSGNTASRPGSPVVGDTFYNGQLGQLEIYNGTTWIAVSAPPLAPTIATPTNASGSDAYSSTGGKLSVVFTRNSSGGEPIQYNAYTTSGGFSASSSTSTVTLTGLTPGTAYTVYGNVSNNFGTSTNSSNASAATPSTLPEAPTIGTAAGGDASATLTFTAGNSGGSSITNYKYSTDGTTYTAFSPAQTTSPLTISGLTNGTSYTFRLKAVNANGDSPTSSASNSVIPSLSLTVDYLVVAGGGGGGGSNQSNYAAAGGGAGGLRSTVTGTGGTGSLESALTLTRSTNYTVTVGGGGNGGSPGSLGTSGSNSVFSTITSDGGGGGGYFNVSGAAGGSGGGRGGASDSAGGAGTSGQGFAGGTGNSLTAAGGGGGGASAVGGNGATNGGAGGAGRATSITGSSVTYAGGGGGGSTSAGTGGAGGAGGGGAGGTQVGSPGQNGTAATVNTGGGGGGASNSDSGTCNGAAGGSGIVILRYLTAAGTITIGAGLTGSTATDGSYKVTTLTAGTGNVSWS
jgi:hypothetical protein